MRRWGYLSRWLGLKQTDIWQFLFIVISFFFWLLAVIRIYTIQNFPNFFPSLSPHANINSLNHPIHITHGHFNDQYKPQTYHHKKNEHTANGPLYPFISSNDILSHIFLCQQLFMLQSRFPEGVIILEQEFYLVWQLVIFYLFGEVHEGWSVCARLDLVLWEG